VRSSADSSTWNPFFGENDRFLPLKARLLVVLTFIFIAFCKGANFGNIRVHGFFLILVSFKQSPWEWS
jgi:hypothetical protein